MDQDYERLTISATDMLQNLVNSQVLRYQRTLEWLDQPVDRFAWIRNGYDQGPAITNAWYDPTVNSITIAAGIIAPVFFGQDQPMSINYGGLAMVLGHELIHGFDDTGRHYGPVGNKFDWWSAESASNFDERAQCISNQYSGYYWDQAGSNLDGANENGENIADNGGIRISYEAYKKNSNSLSVMGRCSVLNTLTKRRKVELRLMYMLRSHFVYSDHCLTTRNSVVYSNASLAMHIIHRTTSKISGVGCGERLIVDSNG